MRNVKDSLDVCYRVCKCDILCNKFVCIFPESDNMRSVRVERVHSGLGPPTRLQPTEHQHGLFARLRQPARRPIPAARGRP